MKIFKNTLTLFAFLAVFSTAAFAQGSTDSDVVIASATIQSALTVTKANDLAFGTLTNLDIVSIPATNTSSGSVSITGASAGVNLNVGVSFPSVLTNSVTGDATTLAFSNSSAAYRTDGTDDATGATNFGTAGSTTINGSFTSTANTMYVYVGGDVDGAGGNAGVTYNGDITVTVSYN